jgi:hypothetical protein
MPAPPAYNALVRYPRFQALHEEIQRCQQLSQLTGEPHCLALEGVTGAGKSTLVKSYAQSFPRSETPEGARLPVLYMEVPSPATIKGAAAAMLLQLGDPAATKGTLWSMNERVLLFIKACGVQLVIWDDFHHLFDAETERVLARVSDWLKVLIKEAGIPFLVVGIEGKVDLILQANPQLSRLFATRETLRPFAWNEAEADTVREFSRFVQFAEQALGRPLASAPPRVEMLYRLHYATGGVVGNVMNLLRYAAWLAGQQGKAELDLPLLSRAFQGRLQKHLRTRADPFAAPADESFGALPAARPAETAPARRGKKRSPSIGEVLSTQ